MEELKETTEALQKAAVIRKSLTFSKNQNTYISTKDDIPAGHWHIYPTTTKKYQDDIFGVEQRSGSRLPGVECGASFSDMSAGTQYFYQNFVILICLSSLI